MRLWQLLFVVSVAAGCNAGATNRDAQAANMQVSQAERDEREAQSQKEKCRAPWDSAALENASRARATDRPFDVHAPVSEKPSALHARFSAYANALKSSAAECEAPADLPEFETEWVYLQEREKARAEAFRVWSDNVAKQEAAREAADHAEEEEAQAIAQSHGFRGIVLGQGVLNGLAEVVEAGAPVAGLKKVAIQPTSSDGLLVAIQVLGQGQALFVSRDDYSDVRVIVERYKGDIYEGTPLSALDVAAWTVVGVRSYKALGGTAQAFVLQPAW